MASNRLPAAMVVVSALLLPTFSTPASALTASETACRDALAQAVTRYSAAAAKAATRCHQRRSDGQRALSTDCNNVSEADNDGKVVASRAKLRAAALAACSGAESLLGFYEGCPAPAAGADDGGATGGIDDFGEVLDCLFALGDAHVGALTHDAQGSPDERLLDPLLKCQGRLGKGGSRLLTTIVAERRRCQEAADRSGEGDYVCDDADPRGRIASAASRFPAKTAPYCDFDASVLSQLDACADDRDGLLACAASSADAHGGELIRSAYRLDGSTVTSTTTTTTTLPPTTTTTLPGTACGDTAPQCNGSCATGSTCEPADGGGCTCVSVGTGACAPATVRRQILSRFTPSIDSSTALNAGWSGLALDIDVPDRAGDMVDLDCDENCENCEVTMHREADGTMPACHCTSDSSIQCGVVNGSDPDNCGSLDPTCRCYFGAPLAISASGNPACVGLRIRNDYTGTANLRTGEWHDTLNLAAVVYLGIGTTNPCPNCEGDPVANDGIKGGTCTGGLGSTPCDVQGVHSTFGAVSHDCLPPSAANISGTGLIIDVGLTTGESRLDAALPCDTPSGALCPCRTCTGNSLLSCSNDAQCAAIGAGVCTASGGAGVRKNMCDGFECTSDWECASGPVETYCDGATFPDGRGYIPCSSNSDCAAGEGSCTILQLRGCTPDPLINQGRADLVNPTSVSSFCVAPTSNPAINIGSGLPGPGSLLITFENEVFCQNDPTIPYEFPDGANCGGAATTTTTLLPLPQCGDADAPACGGVCQVGAQCQGTGGTCTCVELPLPSCEETAAPSCGGLCGNAGEVCIDSAGTCDCQVVTLPQCTDAAAPVCGGVCPGGELCQSVGDSCECGAPGVPSCGAALAPACGGVCDVGEACATNSAGTGCECLELPLPSCAESAPPLCLGTCSTGNTCGAIGDACICSVIPLP